MKEKRLTMYYAVCQYEPIMTQARINIGMVFHIPALKYSCVKVITHAKRLHAFDERFDLNYITKIRATLQQLFESKPGHLQKDIDQDQFLAVRTKADFLGVRKDKDANILPTKYYFTFLPVEKVETDVDHYQELIEYYQKRYL